MNNLTGSDISIFLKKPLVGESLTILKPSDLADCVPGDMVWVKRYSPEQLAILKDRRPSLVICDSEVAAKTTLPNISTSNPRLDFIRVVAKFFTPEKKASIHPTAIIHPQAIIGRNVSIGAYTNIGPKVTIGDACVIGSGVSIEAEVILGRRCVIKANAVLGGQGFGFEYDENGRAIHFPHLGRIILEDDVWLGACSTVELATLGTTRISSGAKVDDLVQVGHNVTICQNTLIMANVVICGGAVVGKKCWIAPNSVIKEKVHIGNNVTVGLGAVVLKNVEDNLIVAGVPAKPLRRNSAY